jgi:branched-subunit amino acid ABC-type transport system permease component
MTTISVSAPGMRATQQKQHTTKIMCIRIERVYSIVCGFSSFIGSAAAMFFAAYSTLDPAFMMKPFLRAFAATLMGGLMSIPGEVIGGDILGLVENLLAISGRIGNLSLLFWSLLLSCASGPAGCSPSIL